MSTRHWVASGLVLVIGLLHPNPLVVPLEAQEVEVTHVRGAVHRIDGAVDVILVSSGEDGLLMVDTGYPFAVDAVRRELQAISGRGSPDLLVNTHHHHAFSNHVYAGDATAIWAHAGAVEIMAGHTIMAGEIMEPFPEGAHPDRTFTDLHTFRFNGEDVTLIPLPGAHTGDGMAVWFRGSGVLATGDVFVPHQPWISLDTGGDVARLLDALDRIVALVPEDVVVVPGHDRTSTLDDVRAFRAMIASAADTVGARIERGLSLRAVRSLGLPEPLARWEGAGVPQELFLESLYRSLVPVRANGNAPTIAFENGRWHHWGRFREGTMYSVGGVLTRERPARVDTVLDLAGGWVVPPFGEAHTHRLGDPGHLSEDLADFLESGVFYAMVQDPAAEVTPRQWGFADDPTTPDVVYTQGVVTPSWGVITRFYDMLARSGRFGDGATLEDLDGRVFFRLDTVGEVEDRWPEIEALNPHFVKVIVAFSDEVAERRADPERYGAEPPHHSALPGVTPEVLRTLVERADAAGIEVSAHVETAADFELALSAGVDWIAHLPASWQVGEGTGYGAGELEPWLLTEEMAMAARRRFTPVVTTLSPWSPDDPRAEHFRAVHEHNLRHLEAMGATVAIGSDQFEGSVVDEVLYLRSLGVYDDTRLLQLLAVQTPRLIFPGRRIGYLVDGYEASFLVLGGDPTEDLERIRDIRLRVKNGVILDVDGPP